jgi:hypothetical protein
VRELCWKLLSRRFRYQSASGAQLFRGKHMDQAFLIRNITYVKYFLPEANSFLSPT